jgi:hypothetical protein
MRGPGSWPYILDYLIGIFNDRRRPLCEKRRGDWRTECRLRAELTLRARVRVRWSRAEFYTAHVIEAPQRPHIVSPTFPTGTPHGQLFWAQSAAQLPASLQIPLHSSLISALALWPALWP